MVAMSASEKSLAVEAKTGRSVWKSLYKSGPIRFLGHFLEMVLAMMPGMAIHGAVIAILSPDYPFLKSTGVSYTLMAIFMTAPMVAWMLFRGHSWRQAGEMSVAMVVPMAVVVALGLTELCCLAMTVGMLAQMLYRRDEYLHGPCHDQSHADGGLQ